MIQIWEKLTFYDPFVNLALYYSTITQCCIIQHIMLKQFEPLHKGFLLTRFNFEQVAGSVQDSDSVHDKCITEVNI